MLESKSLKIQNLSTEISPIRGIYSSVGRRIGSSAGGLVQYDTIQFPPEVTARLYGCLELGFYGSTKW